MCDRYQSSEAFCLWRRPSPCVWLSRMVTVSFEQGSTAGSDDAVLADIVRSVSRQLGGRVDSQAVEAEVQRAAACYRDARIRQYVPIFIQRDVLTALAARSDTIGNASASQVG